MRKLIILSLFGLLLFSACSGTGININLVPTTGDTASDAMAAQQQFPNLSNYGYTSTDARNITDAIAAAGGSAALFTGNAPAAAAIAKLDDMMRCFQNTGSAAAKVYTNANISQLTTGQTPNVGALAIINRTRLQNNLLSCALNTGSGFSAQSAEIEPCAGSGSFVRGTDTFDFVFAATDPQLCTLFQAALQ